MDTVKILPKDCWCCVLSSENVTTGKDFKSIRLVCVMFRDVLSVTLPNGDVDFANPFLTLLNVFGMVVDDVDYISPWMSCEDVLRRKKCYALMSVYNTCGMTDEECMEKGVIPMSVLNNRLGFGVILGGNHPHRGYYEMFCDGFYNIHGNNPITPEEIEPYTNSLREYGCSVYDIMFPYFAPAEMKYSPFVDVQSVLKYPQHTTRDVVSNSKLLKFGDFFDEGVGVGWNLKEVFKNHPELKHITPSDFIFNEVAMSEVNERTRSVILDDLKKSPVTVHKSKVYYCNPALTPKEQQSILGSVVSINKNTPPQEVFPLCKTQKEWEYVLRDCSYTWKDVDWIMRGVPDYVPRECATKNILKNKFGRELHYGDDWYTFS